MHRYKAAQIAPELSLSKHAEEAGLARGYPMLALPVREVLQLERFPKHEDIKDKLVEIHEGMKVIFISQTWLTKDHNDNAANEKCQLLKRVLSRAIEGRLNVQVCLPALLHGMDKPLRISKKQLQADLTDGFVWLDLWSVPQQDRSAQKLAIGTLAHYVASSTYFLCLVESDHVHEDGSRRDFEAWLRRGWCQLEVTANWLSLKAKPFLVVAGTQVWAHMPGGVQGNQCLDRYVGHLDYSYESDRDVVCGVLSKFIDARIRVGEDDASDMGLLWARFLRCYKPKLLSGSDYAAPAKAALGGSLPEWMDLLQFRSVHDGAATGLTPLRFACLAGRADLVKELLDAGADIHARLKRNWVQVHWIRGETPLHVACMHHNELELVQLLIQRGANPGRFDGAGHRPVEYACWTPFDGPATLEALIAHDARLFDRRGRSGFAATDFWAYNSHVGGFKYLKQHHTELFEAIKAVYKHTWLTRVLFNAWSDETLAFWLAEGLKVNHADWTPHEAPPVHSIERVFRVVGAVVRFTMRFATPGVMSMFLGVLNDADALHWTSLYGNLRAARLLIAHGADVNSRHNQMRMTPLHVAGAFGQLSHIQYLLSVGADAQLKDRLGHTAEWHARRHSHDEAADLLRSATTATSRPLAKSAQWRS